MSTPVSSCLRKNAFSFAASSRRPSLPCVCLAGRGTHPKSFSTVSRPSALAKVAAGRQALSAAPASFRRRSRQLVTKAVAMVNVDFASPSLLLGAALIFCGIVLLQLRSFQNKISRDADIVVAAMVSIVGSTLIFQGWRLDPLLLLCQALTTSVAVWYGMETFRLRSKEQDNMEQALRELPPPDAVDNAAAYQGQPQQYYYQQGPPPPPGYSPPTGLPPARDMYYPWGQQQPQQQAYAPENTIRYDYYGNPQDPAFYDQPAYDPQQAYSDMSGAPQATYGGVVPPPPPGQQQQQQGYGYPPAYSNGAGAAEGYYGADTGAYYGSAGPQPPMPDPYAQQGQYGAPGIGSDPYAAADAYGGYAPAQPAASSSPHGPNGSAQQPQQPQYPGAPVAPAAGPVSPPAAASSSPYPATPVVTNVGSVGSGRGGAVADKYERIDDWE